MSIDYRNFSPTGPVNQKQALNARWWALDETDMPSAIAGVINYIQDKNKPIEAQRALSARLYGNSNVTTPQAGIISSTTQKDRVSYNIIQSAIDTVLAKLAKNKPRPMFLTSGGSWKLQRKAQKLGKFVDGIMYENKSHEQGVTAFKDAAVLDTGYTKVFAHNGRVKIERVQPSEIVVDQLEAINGEPRQMHQVKLVDRLVLAEQFPKHREYIMQVNGSLTDEKGMLNSISDPVTVAESWHLPSGLDATDGLHVISINGKCLIKEEYKKDFFPFVVARVAKRINGWNGQSYAEMLQSTQLEINKILWVIQRSMHLMGSFKIWMKTGSKIVKGHLNNDIGSIIESEDPPQYLVPSPVPPEYFQQVQTLIQRGYEQIGVSALSAASKKPEGLDSGKALREYTDIESDRFEVLGQFYNTYYLDEAKLIVSVARDIVEEDGKLESRVPGKKFVETIDWSDVDMDDDQFVMKLFPVSSLPQDPAGRLQTIQEYAQAGFIGPEQARRMLDFPDLEATEELANAPEDRIHKTLEDIIDDGTYAAPDQYMNLELARKLALQYYNHAVCADVEAERVVMLETFMTQLDALEQAMNPPPPMGMPMDPSMDPNAAMAPANPSQTPQSDLLPNVNQVS